MPEKLQLKVDAFSQLAEAAFQDAIICSNSSFKSRDIVEGLDASLRKRTLNMRYYMSPGNRIVELMTDGDTDQAIFPFLADKLKQICMSPYVACKKSTGLILDRLWAAIKREVLNTLAEGVSTPEEIDGLWTEMYAGSHSGPVAMMDAAGLGTVAFIEDHYIHERHLPDTPVKPLKKHMDQGRLGAKSAKGGLLPTSHTTKTPGESRRDDDNVHAPLAILYV